MRASTATVRLILLGCVLMGVCASAWARFQPVSCKNSFTEQQEITEGGKCGGAGVSADAGAAG